MRNRRAAGGRGERSRGGRRKAALGSLLLLVLTGLSVEAQETAGSVLFVTVSDERGSPLPGVELTLRGRSSERHVRGTTDRRGRFRHPVQEPGTSRLEARFDGFGVLVVPEVRFRSGHETAVHLVFREEHLDFGDPPSEIEVAPRQESTPLARPSAPKPERKRTVRVLGLELRIPELWTLRPGSGWDDIDWFELVVGGDAESEEAENRRLTLRRGEGPFFTDLAEGPEASGSVAANGRRFFELPGAPAPYGSSAHYLLVPLADGSFLEIIASRRGRAALSRATLLEMIESLVELPAEP